MAAKCLYQLYDRLAGHVAGPVIPEVRDAAAIRAFHEVLSSNQTLPGQYPNDFELLCVGEQDDATAVIVAYSEPRIVVTGRDWVESQKVFGDASDK